jgi:ParB-like chromosome segregation protein Spo0J
MPLKDSDQRRWVRVMEAAMAALDLPPIRAYRVGDIYFVADGHHRVSVARLRGQDHIVAAVIDVPVETML